MIIRLNTLKIDSIKHIQQYLWDACIYLEHVISNRNKKASQKLKVEKNVVKNVVHISCIKSERNKRIIARTGLAYTKLIVISYQYYE